MPDHSFKVVVRRKTILSEPLYTLFSLLIASVFISYCVLYVFMLPVKGVSGEMKVGYAILVLPRSLVTIFFYSFIGSILTYILYLMVFRHYKAIMMIYQDTITIRGRTVFIQVPIKKITKIYCVDVLDLDGFPKGLMKLHIIYKHGYIKLKFMDYGDIERVGELLTKHENIKIEFLPLDPMLDEQRDSI